MYTERVKGEANRKIRPLEDPNYHVGWVLSFHKRYACPDRKPLHAWLEAFEFKCLTDRVSEGTVREEKLRKMKGK